MQAINILAAVLVIVGALNWGLVAMARFDLVATLFGLEFGQVSPVTAIVYGLVGLAGAYQLVSLGRTQGRRVAITEHAR